MYRAVGQPPVRVAPLRDDARRHPRRVNAVERRSRPYAFDAPRRASVVDAAVAAAARDVLVPPSRSSPPVPAGCIGAAWPPSTPTTPPRSAAIPEGRAKAPASGRPGGGRAILRLGPHDGSDSRSSIPTFRRAPPRGVSLHARPAVRVPPGWGRVTPFVLHRLRAVPPESAVRRRGARSTPPNSTRSRSSAARHHTTSTRTANQTEIGLFWLESSPLGWNRLARLATRRARPWESARLFGLLNVALADGYIGSWRPNTTISSGGRSRRSSSATPTATLTPPAIRTGPAGAHTPDSRPRLRRTASKAARRRRCSSAFFGTDPTPSPRAA